MGFLSVLSYAHQLISARIQPGDCAIDATAGTGADTLLLAQAAGRRGHVFSFDIQEQALALTRERLTRAEGAIAQVTLLQHSHDEMLLHIPAELHGKVAAVMFNLGYLPTDGADHAIITHTPSTLRALEAALQLLRPRGIITTVLYPGHAGGDEEAQAVLDWASALPVSEGQSIIYRQLQRPAAPFVAAIERK
ncbi:class I SAM-dependent methyltransferase [Paenibacillus massiliensis]|uniref:class I SAM-dependent methyltransferase n=1 Tax=Paenibacillus massiliensis TaxID=225917 RepID=UPI000470D0A7|nr:class I SAM-dependent methyltransferase [Paenibacillus massiliensis]